MNKKIFHVINSREGGGAARSMQRLNVALQTRGVDSKVLDCVVDESSEQSLLEHVSMLAYRVTRRVIESLLNNEMCCPYRSLGLTSCPVLKKKIRNAIEHNPGNELVFHIHWIGSETLSILFLRKISKISKIVWTHHDGWIANSFSHVDVAACKQSDFGIYKKIKKKYLSDSIVHIAPSRWMERVLQSALKNDSQIVNISNYFDSVLFDSLRKNKKSGPVQKKIKIMFSAAGAGCDKNKGLDLLVSSAKLLGTDMDNVEMICVGAMCSSMSSKLAGLLDVVVHGPISSEVDYLSFLSVADVVVVPSRHENLSNTIAEAGLLGAYVVAFDVGGNGDMISHRENGFLAVKEEPVSLAQGIAWAIGQVNANHLDRDKNAQFMKNRISVESALDKHLSVYRR